PMLWDFAEINPLGNGSGNSLESLNRSTLAIENCIVNASTPSKVTRASATKLPLEDASIDAVITDPPYYDNISYADLSDFFYVWTRASLHGAFPGILSTISTPKTQELVAMPHRFGGDKRHAERFFEDGLRRAFAQIHDVADPEYPVTVYYAFKQAEEHAGDGIASTGWDTMLTGLLASGFAVTGTWPMRTERTGR